MAPPPALIPSDPRWAACLGISNTVRADIGAHLPDRSPERLAQLSICKQSDVRGDAGPVKFQLQTAVTIDPKRAVIRFTRSVFHASTTMKQIGALIALGRAWLVAHA